MRISDWSSDVCSSDLIGLTAELLGPQDVGQVVEQAVHEGDLAAVIECAGEVDVLRDHHPRRHFEAVGQLEDGRAQQHVQQKLDPLDGPVSRSEEHTSELQSLMRISYAVFCLKKKIKHHHPDRA